MGELISVIVPVYNTEKYLDECIESSIRQTYKNIEVWLINDGSTDGSGKICDDYVATDVRIKVVHKKNEGASIARNLGLELSNGKYITFIDSDDFVKDTYLEYLYNSMKATGSNITFCRYVHYIEDNVVCVHEDIPNQLNVDLRDEKFVEFIYRFLSKENNLFGSSCRILYNKDVLCGVRFNQSIKMSEDLVFLLRAVMQAKRLSCVNEYCYFYRIHSNSTTHTYKKNYLEGTVVLYRELKSIYSCVQDSRNRDIFDVYTAFLCFYLFLNELKFKQANQRKNIEKVRNSEVYKYFTLKNGLKINRFKIKSRYIIVWFLVKTKLI